MAIEDTTDRITELFFSLIRCGIGKGNELPYTPCKEEWEGVYDIAKKQTMLGIAFAGIERIPKAQRPHINLLLQWHQQVKYIRELNKKQTVNSIKVSDKFRSEGFSNCILKGQGIAQYYPDPELRIPGDIDIWLEGGSKKIIEYVKGFVPECKPTYHHVDFPVAEGIDMELHYRPSWMYDPVNNKRLQKYFTSRGKIEFGNTVETSEGILHMPTVEFNIVYIPIHIYRHLFDEGIGMRQILDYYFVLQQPIEKERKAKCAKILKSLGLKRFMQALMYVMQEMFDLGEEQMIVKPDKKQGEFLIEEILMAGNFGQYDSRYEATKGGFNLPHIKKLMKHSFILVTKHPSETCWSPIFKIWHMVWMKRNSK